MGEYWRVKLELEFDNIGVLTTFLEEFLQKAIEEDSEWLLEDIEIKKVST